jgi:serine/threonine protein kinase
VAALSSFFFNAAGSDGHKPGRRKSVGSLQALKLVKQGQPSIQLKELKPLITIGRGAFGIVSLVQHRPSRHLYALKRVQKAKVVAKNMKSQILNEKYILEMMFSPFITRLNCTFKTDQELFFLIEVALGGDLYSVYWKEKLFGLEVHARYYAASVVLALEHMHERFVIYRDMKPENLLLDAKGKLKVTDFGLAKFVVGSTFTVCGTPNFFAPEIVQRVGYTQAADWWAVGVLAWELIVGHPPFHAQREGEVLYMLFTEKVLVNISKPKFNWPKVIPEQSREFFTSLLVYKPSERLPMKPGGKEKLRELAWFSDFSWSSLADGDMDPPYVPPKLDLKNPGALGFEPGLTMRESEDLYVDDGTGWDNDF